MRELIDRDRARAAVQERMAFHSCDPDHLPRWDIDSLLRDLPAVPLPPSAEVVRAATIAHDYAQYQRANGGSGQRTPEEVWGSVHDSAKQDLEADMRAALGEVDSQLARELAEATRQRDAAVEQRDREKANHGYQCLGCLSGDAERGLLATLERRLTVAVAALRFGSMHDGDLVRARCRAALVEIEPDPTVEQTVT